MKLLSLTINWPSTLCLLISLVSCSSKNEAAREEQINIKDQVKIEPTDTTFINSIQGNLSLKQIPSVPMNVILTGLKEHRLVAVYKSKVVKEKKDTYSYSKNYNEPDESETQEHFMPGIDLVYGYNLLNVAHYDLTTENLNFLFDHPVLVKSLYYPSFVQDSVNKKPINRNYYLVSVYDADTNADTLINKRDLRHLYYFDAHGNKRTQLIPSPYSVVRSKYDPMNDVAYVFARQDANGNGKIEKEEPLHVFWFSLKQPAEAKRLY